MPDENPGFLANAKLFNRNHIDPLAAFEPLSLPSGQMETSVVRIRSLAAGATFVGAFVVACGQPPFAAYDVSNHDDPSIKFHFSAANATPASPVVISAPGRKLTSRDDRLRLDLEKAWLAANRPRSLRFVAIGSALCNFKMAGEHPFCEVYEFEDPTTHESVEYYFYVGNWPIAGSG
jgi:hypothetical protein